MDNKTQILDSFFDAYAERFNTGLNSGKADVTGTIQSFANCFIEASPVGIICGDNDDEFKKKIPEGYQFYKQAGITSMDIISKEITLLDELHAMAKVHWSCTYNKSNKNGTIEFDVIYFLQTQNNQPKIFAYITGDEQQALKDHGLI